ncbi:MotA/TolQ/ExbB proton channel family protein [bacterium]|nr:MotA/TolQ/ExbB proton channel family protein [bacterium]
MSRFHPIIFSLALAITAFIQPELAAQDSLIVSFSRIELSGNSEDSKIEFAWNLFKRVPGQDYFEDYTPSEHISYHLVIEGLKDTVTHAESYVFRGSLTLNEKYRCSIAIRPTDSIVDVTQEVNLSAQKEYNRATVSLVQSRKTRDSPIFNSIKMHFNNFIRHGSVFGIAPILSGVFILGFVVGIFYLVRFCLPWTWRNYITNMVQRFDQFKAGEVRKRGRGPAAQIMGSAARKLKQYDNKIVKGEPREKDSRKLARIEQSIKEATDREMDRLAGRTGYKFFSTLFSVEHFWNLGVIAPFLGLLGTVTGISKAFGTVSFFSGLDTFTFKDILDRLSGGINEALYTTIGGLIVGITFLGLYYFFVWRLDCIHKSLAEAGERVLKRI